MADTNFKKRSCHVFSLDDGKIKKPEVGTDLGEQMSGFCFR